MSAEKSQTYDGSVPLARRQWEVFCGAATGYSGGDPVTATDAYLSAYPKTQSRQAARANAARLAARPDVASRCAWMRAQLAQSVLMDSAAVRAKITGMRLDIIDKTKDTCNKHLALQAARDLEKGLGLGEEQREITAAKAKDATETVGGNIAAALAAVKIRISVETTVPANAGGTEIS